MFLILIIKLYNFPWIFDNTVVLAHTKCSYCRGIYNTLSLFINKTVSILRESVIELDNILPPPTYSKLLKYFMSPKCVSAFEFWHSSFYSANSTLTVACSNSLSTTEIYLRCTTYAVCLSSVMVKFYKTKAILCTLQV